MEKDNPENSGARNKGHGFRWWESYFVRYFAGTGVGVIVVLFLANSCVCPSDGLMTIFRMLIPIESNSGYFAILAIFGFTFCYIASAPILVFHATRGHFLKESSCCTQTGKTSNDGVESGKSTSNSIASIWKKICQMPFAQRFRSVIVISVLALLCTIVQNCIPFIAIEFFMPLVFCIIFVSQLYLLLCCRNEQAFFYYDKLAQKRAEADHIKEEYIESYRHLRENGNAFLIILLEFVLGAILFYSRLPWSVILALWVFPAALVWLFGIQMESRDFPSLMNNYLRRRSR